MKPRQLARIGHGTYRLFAGNPRHQDALRTSVRAGLADIIDTSPNYTSEKLVGSVLKQHPESRPRVCTKFGFTSDESAPSAVKVTPGTFHSLDPEFMKAQLSSSLDNLGVDSIDLYLVHNPEHWLMSLLPPDVATPKLGQQANADATLLQDARESLKQRLKVLFTALETEVAAGKIKSYGISSNSFGLPSTHPHFVPYTELIDDAGASAASVGNTKHSFTAIQLPGNIIEREGITPVHLGGNGCATWAQRMGLEVIVNRPLSGFDTKGSWRFVDRPFPEDYGTSKESLLAHLTPDKPLAEVETMSLEEREDYESTVKACNWLKKLINDVDSQIGAFTSVLHYQHDLNNTILPTILDIVDTIDEDTAHRLQDFFTQCEMAVRSVTGNIARQHIIESLTAASKDVSVFSAEEETGYVPGLPKPDQLLQDFALSFLLQHPLVSTVLVGMSSPEQVDSVVMCRKHLLQ